MSTLITNNVLDLDGNVLLAKGQAAKYVNSLQDLLAANMESHKVVNVLNYHTGLEGGGGVFYWDATKPKAEHNGGTVIDPAKVFPTDWNSQTQLTTWFTAASSGTGCWVRQYDGAVNVIWFGAINSKTETSVSSHIQINNAYIAAQKLNKPLLIEGSFYTRGQLTFSNRLNKYYIYANATIRANLTGVSDVNAVYVGDDSSNGVYPLIIDGMLVIRNEGTQRELGKYGFHAQQAAYSVFNISVYGFDIGCYFEGVIYATLDGKNTAIKDNNLDVLIETNQGVQGGLRHTNNLLELRGTILGSSNKVKLDLGSDTLIGLPAVGGLIKFYNVLFEDKTNSVYQLPASIIVSRTSEVPINALNKIVFEKCWFEAFDKTKPLFSTSDSAIILDYCFIAHDTDTDVDLLQITSGGSVHFKNTTGYFADGFHGQIVNTAGNTSVMSKVLVENSEFYGSAGTLPKIHDGLPSSLSGNFSCYKNNGITALAVFKLTAEYANASNLYMENGSIDLLGMVNSVFGTLWGKANIVIYGTDGSSVGIVQADYVKGIGKTIITNTSVTAGASISGNVLSFPTSLSASWYKPLVTITAEMLPFSYATVS